jgi:outer membrane immunogenic protein
MKRCLFAGALGFAVVGQALAADLPQPMPPPPQAPVAYIPAMAPVYNWGGIYFGVNGGYGFGTSKWTTNSGFTTGDFNVSGFVAGPTLGANVQADAFVFGIETDFDSTWIKGSPSALNCAGLICETKTTWLATARGRIGYAADRVLVFGTAGGAFGNVEEGINSTFAGTVKAGWTAGGGIEAAFAQNWTARVDYLFVSLENASFNNGATITTIRYDANIIRAGIDYKFR